MSGPEDAAAGPATPAEEKQSFLEHLEELRRRLLRAALAVAGGFAIVYAQIDRVFEWLLLPYRSGVPDARLVQITLTEAFMTKLKLGIWGGLLLASPVVLYQLWAFVAPGLYRHERRLVGPLVVSSTILFALGAAFTYTVVLPFGLKYLTEMGGPNVDAMLSMASYVSSACFFMATFGLIFQIPLLMLVLGRTGVVRAATLARNRKYVLLGSFVIGAVLSPPDIVSQALVSVPLFLLFESSIWLMRVQDLLRRRRAGAAGETPAG